MAAGSAEKVVTWLEQRIEPLEVAFHRAYWASQVEASPENDEERARLELELRSTKGDPEALREVESALSEDLHDPVVKRRLQVLRLSLTANQMDERSRQSLVDLATEVESEFATYRPSLGGTQVSDNEIEQVLKDSDDDAERQAAWRASKEIGTRVMERVRELARIRNAKAHDAGFSDHYSMALELQELREDWLFGVLDALEGLTRDPFERWKGELDEQLKARFGVSDLYPWHHADPFFQSIPPDGQRSLDDRFGEGAAEALARRTFDAWGVPLDRVLDRSDLYPRQLKCQHAFCLDVDRQGDVRILANVVPGERWVEVMLHECGHAAYDVSIEPTLPYLLRRPAHTFVTEAVAIMSGRLVRDPHWLRSIARIEGDDVAGFRRGNILQSLLFARWGLVMVHFERALYADPEGDLDGVWWELVERFQLSRAPADPPPGAWAAKIHIAVAPVYYHNYLLGELLASQLEDTMKKAYGEGVTEETGGLLVDRLFRSGNLLRWDALVEEATGTALEPDAHARYLRSEGDS